MCLSGESDRLPPKGETVVYHTPDGAPYVLCSSKGAFQNPTAETVIYDSSYCERVNQQLNLNLGQKIVTRKNVIGRLILFVSRLLDKLLLEWWETWLMHVWSEVVPVKFKRMISHGGWNIFCCAHKMILGKASGLHPSQSLEYHALTTALFVSQFVAMTPRRMRFFLSEIYINAPNEPPSPDRISEVEQSMTGMIQLPPEQADHATVRGWMVRHPKGQAEGTIFWIYGGAYLAGDVRGNASIADWVAQRTNMNVFIPHFRLAPEANIFDVLWDICVAYRWLSTELSAEASTVYLVGVSSGAAVATRLMQLIGQSRHNEDLDVPAYFNTLVKELPMPAGAVLFNPYVDYEMLHDHEKKGSFLHYADHDLIVNQAVQEYGLPYLSGFIPGIHKGEEDGNPLARKRQSPIHQSCRGMPPLFVVASEHEAVYDMNCALVNRARKEGVEVTFGVWKYMCHVFTLLHGFFPEGQISMDYVIQWINNKQIQRKAR